MNLKAFSIAQAKEEIKPEGPTVFISSYLFEVSYFLLKMFACKMGILNSNHSNSESVFHS